MAQTISRHNSRLAKQEQTARSCNWSGDKTCPNGGQCLKGPVVYRAAVTANNHTEFYTGIAGNSFKERVGGHLYDFNHWDQRKSTTLSKHIWDHKQNGRTYDLSWSLMETAPTYNHTTGKCRLCLREKWYIMFRPDDATLNDRSEFYSTCRHRLKNLLWKFKSWRGPPFAFVN